MSNILKYQNPSSPLLIQQVNQSGANFVKRLLDPDRKSIPDWETKGTKIATHKLGWAEDDQGAYVYPKVQEINGQLIDFSRPPYDPGIADYMAHKNNNIVRMSPEEADWFTRNYKQYYPSFKKGGRIHIKKKNRGRFTEYCGGKVTEECIRKGKNSPDPAVRKRATFAANARKWKHKNGGQMIPNIIKFFNGGGIPMFQNSGKLGSNPLYPRYGSREYAKFAYWRGDRNPEAIGAALPDRLNEDVNINGTSFSTITNDNGKSTIDFKSDYTHSYDDGMYDTIQIENSNNNGK